jgi:hypothetical protein
VLADFVERHDHDGGGPPPGLDQLGGVYRQPVPVVAAAVQRLEVDDVAVLARGSMPAELLDDLMESVRVGEASMADALVARAREHPDVPAGTFTARRTET